jgi:hypothetical protein
MRQRLAAFLWLLDIEGLAEKAILLAIGQQAGLFIAFKAAQIPDCHQRCRIMRGSRGRLCA